MLNNKYACPYCNQDSYAEKSKCKGFFTSWAAVAKHTSRCKKSDNSFAITSSYGPLHYSIFTNFISRKEFLKQFPLLENNYKEYIKQFKKYNWLDKDFKFKRVFYTEKELINYIIKFVTIYNKIPTARDFKYTKPNYSNFEQVFGTWNKAIQAAGYEPSIQNGFGINTYGLDGHLYRSRAEAYFADTFLYNKYDYIIEPKYTNGLWLYDWYVKDLNLYIELDGGLRPERMQEKLKINNFLQRNLVVYTIPEIYRLTTIE